MSSILYIYSSQEFDILRWCYILIFGYMFLLVVVFVVMVFRETESQQAPDDNDKAGIIIDESETGFKRADNVEKADKNEETESKQYFCIYHLRGVWRSRISLKSDG